jgi:hypothetical protein
VPGERYAAAVWKGVSAEHPTAHRPLVMQPPTSPFGHGLSAGDASSPAVQPLQDQLAEAGPTCIPTTTASITAMQKSRRGMDRFRRMHRSYKWQITNTQLANRLL